MCQSREVPLPDLQTARKNALVALANLSDAFNRMLSEPKSRQKEIEHLHQFVVLNHRLTSHIATLLHYLQAQLSISESVDLRPLMSDVDVYLQNTVSILKKDDAQNQAIPPKESLHTLYKDVNVLLMKRKEELNAGQLETSTKKKLSELKSIVDQFKFVYKIAADLYRISGNIKVANL